MTKKTDDDVTPVQTPSALHRLGLATCPVCEGSRVRDGERCPFCDGAGRVTLERAGEWFGLTPVVKK
jgi:DnaJ-class molecular chaperone